VYDPATNEWTTRTPLPIGRHGTAIGTVNGVIYAAGGNGGDQGILANNDAFTPGPLENAPPVANAGPDVPIHAGQVVMLDGLGSHDDNTATEDLAFAWTLVSRPVGSTAVLSNTTGPTTTFVADRAGTYVASLVVTDSDGLSSEPATVNVSSVNAAPVANAGPDQASFAGDTVSLSSAGSYDPDTGDTLTYAWVLAAPTGSGAVLGGATTPAPSFVPDLIGTYTATLTVSDGLGGTAVDEVIVSVVTPQQYAAAQTGAALNEVGALPPGSVTSPGNPASAAEFPDAGDVVDPGWRHSGSAPETA
jgi:hypothetical protein